MKEKRFSPKKAWIPGLFKSRGGVFLSHWIMQGMWDMNGWHRCYRLVCEGAMIICCSVFLTARGIGPLSWVVSVFVTHTAWWLLFGNFFGIRRFLLPTAYTYEKNERYLFLLGRRAARIPGVLGVMIVGSMARGVGAVTASSDCDVRILQEEGPLPALSVFCFCMIEAVRALLRQVPLEIYAFGLQELKEKVDKNEPVRIILDSRDALRGWYRMAQ